MCAIVVPEETIRTEVVRVLNAAGLQGVIADAASGELRSGLVPDAPLRVAVIELADGRSRTLQLVSRLRTGQPDCVIFALDRADTERSAAHAFAAGADDVLRMPFRAAEFEARLQRVLRPGHPADTTPPPTELEELTARLDLTPVEGRILEVLLDRVGQIVTRNELSQALHGTDWAYGDRRFDVHVTRIRRKLREVGDTGYAVQTIRSVGYMLAREAD